MMRCHERACLPVSPAAAKRRRTPPPVTSLPRKFRRSRLHWPPPLPPARAAEGAALRAKECSRRVGGPAGCVAGSRGGNRYRQGMPRKQACACSGPAVSAKTATANTAGASPAAAMARRPLFRFSASRLCAFSGFAASFRTSTFPSLRRYAVVFDPVRPEPANSEPDNSNLATALDKSQYRFLLCSIIFFVWHLAAAGKMARPSAVPQITAPVRHAPVARFAPPPGSGEASFFARIACARAPARSRRRGFARLIARASQTQGARLPSVPLGVFRAGARRSGVRTPLAPDSCYHGISRNKSPRRTKQKFFQLRLAASGEDAATADRLLYNRSFTPGGVGPRNGPYRPDAAQPDRRRRGTKRARPCRRTRGVLVPIFPVKQTDLVTSPWASRFVGPPAE